MQTIWRFPRVFSHSVQIKPDSGNAAPKDVFRNNDHGHTCGKGLKGLVPMRRNPIFIVVRVCVTIVHVSIVHDGSKRRWKARILSYCSPGNGYRLSEGLEADKLHVLFVSIGDVFV